MNIQNALSARGTVKEFTGAPVVFLQPGEMFIDLSLGHVPGIARVAFAQLDAVADLDFGSMLGRQMGEQAILRLLSPDITGMVNEIRNADVGDDFWPGGESLLAALLRERNIMVVPVFQTGSGPCVLKVITVTHDEIAE
ncbi:hypothetical protein SDC9_154000 [bioreactor metagenome]|uniref:Uncharacterized protein n=1 Tax=bioreactor metagenome TaxID=1076179 RepID=A0A645F2D9_9ZZZZ